MPDMDNKENGGLIGAFIVAVGTLLPPIARVVGYWIGRKAGRRKEQNELLRRIEAVERQRDQLAKQVEILRLALSLGRGRSPATRELALYRLLFASPEESKEVLRLLGYKEYEDK